MRNWLRSPTLLKYLVGQHIANGLSVAASVAAVSFVASMILGFGVGQPATLGAIGASVSDFPGPWRVKAETITVGFGLSIVSTILVQAASFSTVAQVLCIGAIAFGAGLVTGFGRWALALSAQVLVPMVFVLGLPPLDFAGAARVEALYILGGVGYFAFSMGFTALSAPADRRMMVSEALRELAAYLTTNARLSDVNVDLTDAFGAGIRQQAALSEQLQAARALLLTRARASRERLRLAATIGLMLDVFDALVAALCDIPKLRRTPEATTLLARIAVLLRAGSLDIQRLSLDLLAHREPKLPPDHAIAFNAAQREADRLLALDTLGEDERSAVAATIRRIALARADILKLEHALSDDSAAEAAIAEVDFSAFRPRRSFDPRQLRPHLSLGSPVLRYAVRLSLAMMTGSVVAAGLGVQGHGNWVLLTIAVILRPTYGLTRQRRDDRLIGTLIGCGLSAGAVDYLPLPALVFLQAGSLALVHGFVRLNYRLASVGASMSALISLHLITPEGHAAALTRLADTIVGAAISHVFNHFWPSWEASGAPALAQRLIARAFAFAEVALDPKGSDQVYRLGRKDVIEAVAALSDSAARMGGEPVSARRGLEEMSAMLIATSVFVAHVSAARLDLRGGEKGGDPESIRKAVNETRVWLAKRAKATGVMAPAAEGHLPRLRRAAEALISAAHEFAEAARDEQQPWPPSRGIA
jgi:uncharacterized membrane protein YccC